MTSSVSLDQAAAALRQLAELVYQGESYSGIYEEICRIALQVVPRLRPCVHHHDQRRSVPAARGDHGRGRGADRPHGVGGPRGSVRRRDPDRPLRLRLGHHQRTPTWPRLAERVLALTPRPRDGRLPHHGRAAEGGRAQPLLRCPRTPEHGGAEVGAILASFASVAITAAREKSGAENLLAGLINNREIGKAIGVLMVTEGITDDEAFERLRTASNHLNVRLAEIARRVVADTDPGAPDLV